MSYLKRGIWSLSGLFILIAAANVVGYFTRAILARVLGPDEFGLFYSAFALIMLLSILTVGVNGAVVKFIPSLMVKKKFGEIKYLITLTSSWRIIVSGIVSAAMFMSADWLAQIYFKVPSAPLVKVFALVLFCHTLTRIASSVLNGLQRNILYGLVEFSRKFLFLVLIWVFIRFSLFEKSPQTASYALAGGFALTALIYLIPAAVYSRFFQSVTKKSKSLRRKVIHFSLFSTLTYAASSLITHIDTVMLTSMRTLTEVGVYNVVMPTVMVLTVFGSSIHKIYFPMVSEIWAKKQASALRQGFDMLYKYTLVTIAPLALALVVFAKEVIIILFTSDYVAGYTAMQVLPFGVIFLATYQVIAAILKGIGKPQEVTKMVVIIAVLNIIGNVVLIYHLGVLGAAIATTLSYLILMILSIITVKKHVDIHPNYGQYLRIVIASVIFVGVAHATRSLLAINQYLEAAVCLTAAGVAYIAACFVLKLISVDELKLFFNNARGNQKVS